MRMAEWSLRWSLRIWITSENKSTERFSEMLLLLEPRLGSGLGAGDLMEGKISINR